MSAARRLFVVVPVLNEAPNIPRLIASLESLRQELEQAFAVHVMLVDDGSTDGTAEQARRLGGNLSLEILVHEVNRGPGRSFATAFAHLATRLHADDKVLTVEGDNTSRLSLVRQMLTRADEGFDCVLASPYLYGGGIVHTSAWRTFLSGIANLIVKDWLGVRGLVTVSSFFRLFRGGTILRLQQCYGPGVVERDGFESMVELVMKLANLRSAISEVAMVLDTSQRIGKSKMKVVRTSFGYLALILHKQRWARLAEATRGQR